MDAVVDNAMDSVDSGEPIDLSSVKVEQFELKSSSSSLHDSEPSSLHVEPVDDEHQNRSIDAQPLSYTDVTNALRHAAHLINYAARQIDRLNVDGTHRPTVVDRMDTKLDWIINQLECIRMESDDKI